MEPIRVYDNPPRDAWPALTARVTRDDAEIDRRVAAILNEVRTGAASPAASRASRPNASNCRRHSSTKPPAASRPN